jgi:glucose-1-phosphate adenylyltransferase
MNAMHNSMHGIIFAYGKRPRLQELVELRVADALPFLCRYRMIDFVLSSMVNAGVTDVGIILQEKYQSMLDHLGSGKDWDLSRKHGGLHMLPSIPQYGSPYFRGRMEALFSVQDYLRRIRQDYVVMAEGQIAANLPLADMLEEHIASGADISVVCTKQPLGAGEDSTSFVVGADGFVTDTVRHIGVDGGYSYLDVCILSKELLLRLVDECESHNLFRFREDVLQGMKDRLSIHACVFGGYAAKIQSVAEYYARSMELLDAGKRADLFNPARPIRTKDRSDASTYYGPDSECANSLVADGCVIEGKVRNSILFRGVRVEAGAEISNCVLMQDSIVRRGAILKYIIADKQVEILADRTLMGHEKYPLAISKMSIV